MSSVAIGPPSALPTPRAQVRCNAIPRYVCKTRHKMQLVHNAPTVNPQILGALIR